MPDLKLDRDEDKNVIDQLTMAVGLAVKASFVDGKGQTRHEIVRRGKWAAEMARNLRYDMGWSYMRIKDELPRALRAWLTGEKWNPEDQHSQWVPFDAQGEALEQHKAIHGDSLIIKPGDPRWLM